MNWRSRLSAPSPATAIRPWATKNASTPTRTVTSTRCSPLVSFAPTTLRTAKATVSATAIGLMGTSKKNTR